MAVPQQDSAYFLHSKTHIACSETKRERKSSPGLDDVKSTDRPEIDYCEANHVIHDL